MLSRFGKGMSAGFSKSRPVSMGQSTNRVIRTSRRGAAKMGSAASRLVLRSPDTMGRRGFGGRGLSTMRRNRTTTGAIRAEGMNVAAGIRRGLRQ